MGIAYRHQLAALLLATGVAAAILAALPPMRLAAHDARPPAVLVAVFPPWKDQTRTDQAILQTGAIPLKKALNGTVWWFISTDASHPQALEERGAWVLMVPGVAGVMPTCTGTTSRTKGRTARSAFP
ncbi:MAG: hypothetical protein JJT90_06705 [Ectothiorhodospiraceae bacterium]|nr:hypothetical protein [Ectothiorhodospiraceae bacterium]